MNYIKLFLEGLIIGFGKIMPGVSGSVMAICFGVYEKLVESFSSIKCAKKNFKFLMILGLGIVVAIIFGSNIIKYLLINHYTKTMMVFIGMMIPGVIPLFNEIKKESITFKNSISIICIFLALLILSIFPINSGVVLEESFLHRFISLMICGILDAASTIIPGISGSAILMMIGYYDTIIVSLANPFTVSGITVLIPFLIGLAMGLIAISKIITYLFKHKRSWTYMLIVMFSTFSIISLLNRVVEFTSSQTELFTSSIFLIIGVLIIKVLERLLNKK